jgi:hypothetical protein
MEVLAQPHLAPKVRLAAITRLVQVPERKSPPTQRPAMGLWAAVRRAAAFPRRQSALEATAARALTTIARMVWVAAAVAVVQETALARLVLAERPAITAVQVAAVHVRPRVLRQLTAVPVRTA